MRIGELDYDVDALGRILKKKGKGERKTFPDKDGYLKYSLQQNGKTLNFFVHRFVYQYFKGPIPDTMTVDHIDGDKLNNQIDNLQLLNAKENAIKGNARTWIVFRPNHSSLVVYNMEEFCRKNDLHPGHMRATAKLNSKHKGWYCYERN